jgi:hypothetical protein
MCCYDKILVNVVAHVIPSYMSVCVCVCGSVLVSSAPHIQLTRNYIFSHIYQDFIVTTQYDIVFCLFNN